MPELTEAQLSKILAALAAVRKQAEHFVKSKGYEPALVHSELGNQPRVGCFGIVVVKGLINKRGHHLGTLWLVGGPHKAILDTNWVFIFSNSISKETPQEIDKLMQTLTALAKKFHVKISMAR